MSGETTTEAKTCVFWDVDDCPISEGLDLNSIFKNIKSALANQGFDGIVEFKVYGRDETLPDEFPLDAGITYKRKATKYVREMLFHICEWAMVNPKGSNLLLISKINPEEEEMLVTPEEDKEEEMLVTPEEDEEEDFVIPEEDKLVTTVGVLAHRGYNVLLAPPELSDKPVLHFTPRSVWLWTSLSYGGLPSLTRTSVFWDLGELRIPNDVYFCDAARNIEYALASGGFPGSTSFRFFFYEETIPYEDVDSYKEGRIAFFPISQGGLISRLEWMLLHIYFCAIENPVSGAKGEEHRLMLVSDSLPKEPEFMSVLQALITKGYKVLLVNKVQVPSITTLHTEWVWRSMFHGSNAQLCHHCGQSLQIKPKAEISDFNMFEETAEPEPSTDAKLVSRTGIFWDLDDLVIPTCLHPVQVRDNIESALNTKGFRCDWAIFCLYAENLRWPDDLVRLYENVGYCVFKDGNDKISKACWMLLEMYLWLLDNPEVEYNMLIVSKHIAEEPEFVRVLETLKSRCHKVLLVQPEPMEEAESFGTEKLAGFFTESVDWLWRNLLGEGSPVGGGSPLGREVPRNHGCPHCGTAWIHEM